MDRGWVGERESGPGSGCPSRSVLQGLGQVGGVDILCPGEVGDGAGEFEDAVVGAGAEVHLADGGLHQVLAVLIDLAVALDLAGPMPPLTTIWALSCREKRDC